MPLYSRSELRSRGEQLEKSLSRDRRATASRVLLEEAEKAATTTQFDVFLSHSYLDAVEILALKREIESFRLTVYVDWVVDAQMSRDRVTPETAAVIRGRICQCTALLYASSVSSGGSKWMPWELGYADGQHGRVAVVPLTDAPTSSEGFQGQEYLGLYPYITKTEVEGASTQGLWVNDDETTYVTVKQWLQGTRPYVHR